MADGDAPARLEDTMTEVYDRIAAEEKTARANEAAEVAEPPEVAAPSGNTAEAPASSGSDATPPASAVETEAEKAERLRADDGKFRKPTKAEKKAAPAETAKAADPKLTAQAAPNAGVTQQPGTVATGAASGLTGVTPPTSWSPAAKEAFATLPPAVQAAVATREAEVTKGFSHYEGIRQALAPVANALQMRGAAPAQYIAQMVQIDRALSDPATRAQTFDYLARTYGFQMPQAPANGNAQTDPQQVDPLAAHPTFAALQQQVQQLTGFTQNQIAAQRAQDQSFVQETQRQAGSDVEQFRADKANEFFDLVRDDMRSIFERAAVMKTAMPTLKDAYDQAIWANPKTQPVLLARHVQKLSDDAAKAAGDAAARARKSQSPNVRGTNGATPGTGPLDMKAEMAAVYDRLHAS